MEKSCHLSVEIEHNAFWDLMSCNFEFAELRTNRLMQMNALQELRNKAYTNSLFYRTKQRNEMMLGKEGIMISILVKSSYFSTQV